jgi:hypothetical protein
VEFPLVDELLLNVHQVESTITLQKNKRKKAPKERTAQFILMYIAILPNIGIYDVFLFPHDTKHKEKNSKPHNGFFS